MLATVVTSVLTTGLLTAIAGYLVGSIPTAYLVGSRVTGVDVRTAGEGNVGARNVFHLAGPHWGIVVFAVDFSKGALVALLFAGAPPWQLGVAGSAALIGHGYPVWLNFTGGKGLSTAGGFTAVLMPWAVVIGVGSAGLVWSATRRFLPTTVAAIVVAVVAAPFLGVQTVTVGLVLWMFILTGAKRLADESRMREVEARTGWDRIRGLRP